MLLLGIVLRPTGGAAYMSVRVMATETRVWGTHKPLATDINRNSNQERLRKQCKSDLLEEPDTPELVEAAELLLNMQTDSTWLKRRYARGVM
jgi:hypothetical protein